MMESDKALGKVVNTGQGKETDIRTVVSMICDELDYPLDKIDQKPPRPADVRRLLADTTLARKLLGYSAKTSLEEGIRFTIDWFRSEKNNTASRARLEKS